MDTWETVQADSLTDEIKREVKRRLAGIQADSSVLPCRRTALILGKPEESEEKILNSSFRTITSPKEGDWDIAVAAQIPVGLLADVAQGMMGGLESQWILESMLEGKRVYFLEKGLQYRQYRDSSCRTLFQKYQGYEAEIRRLGVFIVPDAGSVGERETSPPQNISSEGAGCDTPGAVFDLTGLKLLKESDLGRMRGTGCRTIFIGKKTIITPLAKDYISNHNLAVRRQQ